MNILRLSTLSLAVALAVLALAYANPSFAGKKCDEDPTHPSCKDDGGGDPPDPGPSSCPGDFPAFAYAVEITDKRGHTERSDLKVSNANGSCEVLVHSVSTADFYSDLNFHFDASSDLYRIAYNYESDESDTRTTGARPNIRVMEFTVSPDGVETKIDQTLPLEVHKIYRYSRNSTSGRGLSKNDIQGNSLVFHFTYGEAGGTKKDPTNDWYGEIWVIEDIADCIASYGPEPDENCATAVLQSEANRKIGNPVWGLDNNRIYVRYDWDSSPDSDMSVAMFDRADPGSPWSAPGAVRLESDDGAVINEGRVAPWDYGLGTREAMRLNVNGSVQIFDISSACTAAAASVQSCYSQGLMTLAKDFPGQTLAGHWWAHGTIDAGPNFLQIAPEGGIIREFDPDSDTEADIITGLPRNVWVAPEDSF